MPLLRPLAVLAVITSAAGLGLAAPAQASTTATRAFSTSFTDTCTVLNRDYQVPAVVTGQLPTSVARGAVFRVSDVVLSATIPASLATDAYDLGARRALITLQAVNARGVGVLPAVKDVITTDLSTPRLAVRRGRPLPFTLPTAGGVGTSFRAGDTRGTGLLQAGTVRATITLYDQDGEVLASDVPISCSAPKPVVTVTSIKIT